MTIGQTERPNGPLSDLTVLEVGGIGPLPLFGWLMVDLGAWVIRIDPVNPAVPRVNPDMWIFRGRESLTLDLRQREGVEVLLRLTEHSDVLVEGYRPGVAERLGIAPEVCQQRNPRLVYGRMTGWGSYGPLAHLGGHDLNYVAISGGLHAIGPKGEPPTVPLNLIGDYGGGAMMLAFGVLAAVHEAQRSGQGQVVESAMCDGAIALMAQWYAMRDIGQWTDERESNLIDGGSPFYRCYETKDGKYVAVGAIEEKFYAALLEGLGLDATLVFTQRDRSTYPELQATIEATFKTKTRAQWEAVFSTRDACFSPVLTMVEAMEHPHNVERGTFVEAHDTKQVAPPVRFGRTPAGVAPHAPAPGADNDALLAEIGYGTKEIEIFRALSVVD